MASFLPDLSGTSCCLKAVSLGYTTFVAASAVTMLVVGILGLLGHLPMAYSGAVALTSIGSILTLAIPGALAKQSNRNAFAALVSCKEDPTEAPVAD